MVTKTRQPAGRRRHLFLAEWMEERGLGDQALADKVGYDRVTVTRYRSGQEHRLNPDKIARIADALDIEPGELWRPPNRRSVDAMLKNASDELVQRAAEMAAILLKTPR